MAGWSTEAIAHSQIANKIRHRLGEAAYQQYKRTHQIPYIPNLHLPGHLPRFQRNPLRRGGHRVRIPGLHNAILRDINNGLNGATRHSGIVYRDLHKVQTLDHLSSNLLHHVGQATSPGERDHLLAALGRVREAALFGRRRVRTRVGRAPTAFTRDFQFPYLDPTVERNVKVHLLHSMQLQPNTAHALEVYARSLRGARNRNELVNRLQGLSKSLGKTESAGFIDDAVHMLTPPKPRKPVVPKKTVVRKVVPKFHHPSRSWVNKTKTNKEVQPDIIDAYDTMGKVHNVPSHLKAEVTSIPNSKTGMVLHDGEIRPISDVSPEISIEKGISSILLNPRFDRLISNKEALIHENGHLLDYGGVFGSPKGVSSIGSENPHNMLFPLTAAFSESAFYTDVNKVLDRVNGRISLAGSSPNHRDLEMRNQLEYMTKPEEMFARAYTQWIGVRSNDAHLLGKIEEDLHKQRTDRYHIPQFFNSKDFAPISREFDALFKRVGLLTSEQKAKEYGPETVTVPVHVPETHVEVAARFLKTTLGREPSSMKAYKPPIITGNDGKYPLRNLEDVQRRLFPGHKITQFVDNKSAKETARHVYSGEMGFHLSRILGESLLFGDSRWHSVDIEKPSQFDNFGGRARMTDAAYIGHSPILGKISVSVEGKAGEEFGQEIGRKYDKLIRNHIADTLETQYGPEAADKFLNGGTVPGSFDLKKATAEARTTNGARRIENLLNVFHGTGTSFTTHPHLRDKHHRDQLYYGIAAARADGERAGAVPVFFVYEFHSDPSLAGETVASKMKEIQTNKERLKKFMKDTFNVDVPNTDSWMLKQPVFLKDDPLKERPIYIAKHLHDIRTKPGKPSPATLAARSLKNLDTETWKNNPASALHNAKSVSVRPAHVTLLDGSVHITDFLHPLSSDNSLVNLGDGSTVPIKTVRKVTAGDGTLLYHDSSRATTKLFTSPVSSSLLSPSSTQTLPNATEPITSFRDENAFLSNFAPVNVRLFGKDYPSVEHAYQAAKTEDAGWKERIRNAPTPGAAKRLGKQAPLKRNWEKQKLSVMKALLKQKFSQEPYKSALLGTGDRQLVEGNNWGDTFFGVDVNKGGRNELGKALMELRTNLGGGSLAPRPPSTPPIPPPTPIRPPSSPPVPGVSPTSVFTHTEVQRVASVLETKGEHRFVTPDTSIKGDGTSYAGVGSRQTPPEIQKIMTDLARELGSSGKTLRSGGAPAADTAFENGAIEANVLKKGPYPEVYLPWNSLKYKDWNFFKHRPHGIYPGEQPEAVRIAKEAHPAWNRMRRGGQALQTRNVNQVLGRDPSNPDPVKFVVGWTPGGNGGGGTGQAFRIARAQGIPVYDLGKPGELDRLRREQMSGSPTIPASPLVSDYHPILHDSVKGLKDESQEGFAPVKSTIISALDTLDTHIRLPKSHKVNVGPLNVLQDGKPPNEYLSGQYWPRWHGDQHIKINHNVQKWLDLPITQTSFDTFIHEYAHWIDHMLLGTGSEGGNLYGSQHAPELDTLLYELRRTNYVRRLRNFRQSAEEEHRALDKTHLDYLLSNKELFARSFTQWIGTRSKNGGWAQLHGRDLAGQVAGQIEGQYASEYYGSYWTPEEFKPVAQAFEDLFRRKGWLKDLP